MNSRMERHYELNNSSTSTRTNRNQTLYKTIYEDIEYTNVEGIASIGKTNEIDITKIKELLKSREEYKKERDASVTITKTQEYVEIEEDDDVEEKTYDLKDILNKAKIERTNYDDKKRSLDNEKYNILKRINETQKNTYNNLKEIEEEEQELKELLNTLTNATALSNMDDNNLSIDLFDDLKGSGNTEVVSSNTAIKSILEEAKDEYNNNVDDDDEDILDKSFYTNRSGLSTKDFEDLEGVNNNLKRNNILIIVVLVLLFFLLLGIGIYLGMKAF